MNFWIFDADTDSTFYSCVPFRQHFLPVIIHARPMEFAETYLQHFSIIFARPIELSGAAQLPQVRGLGARGLPGRTDNEL